MSAKSPLQVAYEATRLLSRLGDIVNDLAAAIEAQAQQIDQMKTKLDTMSQPPPTPPQ